MPYIEIQLTTWVSSCRESCCQHLPPRGHSSDLAPPCFSLEWDHCLPNSLSLWPLQCQAHTTLTAEKKGYVEFFMSIC